jgi:hypothetical protein
MAVMDQTDLFGCKLIMCDHCVYSVMVMNALERVNNVIVHLDGAVNGEKVIPEGFEPFRFQVG